MTDPLRPREVVEAEPRALKERIDRFLAAHPCSRNPPCPWTDRPDPLCAHCEGRALVAALASPAHLAEAEPREQFTREQTIVALEEFARFGEEQYGKAQLGYFSGGGWAARCLRAHLTNLHAALSSPAVSQHFKRGDTLSLPSVPVLAPALAAKCLTHGPFDPRCEVCPQCLQERSLRRLAEASASHLVSPEANPPAHAQIVKWLREAQAMLAEPEEVLEIDRLIAGVAHQPELRALIEKWRGESGSWEPGIGSGIEMCADELEAALSASVGDSPRDSSDRKSTPEERAMARGFITLWETAGIQDADDWLYVLRNRAELLAADSRATDRRDG